MMSSEKRARLVGFLSHASPDELRRILGELRNPDGAIDNSEPTSNKADGFESDPVFLDERLSR